MLSLAELSFALKLPLLFPSVGPTAIAVITRPALKQNRPLSIIGAHIFGMGVALGLLYVFRIYGAPSTLQQGFTQTRILVVALAIGITTIFEEETPLYHPPAAATTILVALGMMTTPIELFSIVIGILLTAAAAAIYEFFSPKERPEKVKREVAKTVT
jgi:CBS domain-containing membrane protein